MIIKTILSIILSATLSLPILTPGALKSNQWDLVPSGMIVVKFSDTLWVYYRILDKFPCHSIEKYAIMDNVGLKTIRYQSCFYYIVESTPFGANIGKEKDGTRPFVSATEKTYPFP